MAEETPNRLVGVDVEAYRGLRGVSVSDLGDINVLIGPSNTGKTSFLEAVWLAATFNNLRLAIAVVLRNRGTSGLVSLSSLFPGKDGLAPINVNLRLVSKGTDERQTLTINASPAGTDVQYADMLSKRGWSEYTTVDASSSLTPGRPCSLQVALRDVKVDVIEPYAEADVAPPYIISGAPTSSLKVAGFSLPLELTSVRVFDQAYSIAFQNDTLSDILATLRTIAPDLRDIRPIQVGDQWVMYAQVSQGAIPLFAMGDGFKAAFVLLSYVAQDGLVLLDSPEAFQHPRGLEVIAKAVVSGVVRSQARSQVLVATQSLELLDLLIQESTEQGADLKIYRFGISDGQVKVYPPYTLEEAKRSRELIGTDLRG